MNIAKITCLISGKTWLPDKVEQHGEWITIRMKNRDVVSFHKDNSTIKIRVR